MAMLAYHNFGSNAQCYDEVFEMTPLAYHSTSISEKSLVPIVEKAKRYSNIEKISHGYTPKQQKLVDDEWPTLEANQNCLQAVNKIRHAFEKIEKLEYNQQKLPIRMNLGDPTLARNLGPHDAMLKAVEKVLSGQNFNGYLHATGAKSAKQAITRKYTHPNAPINEEDVILSSGCSHALDMIFSAISTPGDNILLPDPGFPLYSTLCCRNRVESRFYPIDLENDGLIDLVQLEAKIDKKTKAILINNPSNPTGIVFPKWHLEAILRIAYKYKLAIIADEIYGDLTFNNMKFYPLATLSPKVPIICCAGISKQYLVPGWRLGWIILHNRYNALSEIKSGITSLAQQIMGPSSLIQGALPDILYNVPNSFFENIRNLLQTNSDMIFSRMVRIPGLKPLRPSGAMYMMVKFDPEMYGNESDFVEGLIHEESLYTFSGSLFNAPNWLRLLLTFPEETTKEACDRIEIFCQRRRRIYNWHK